MSRLTITHACLVAISMIAISCHQNLLRPVQGGQLLKPQDGRRRHGDNYYIKPDKDFEVRATEDSRIVSVISIKDQGTMIVAEGNFEAGYGNLMEASVINGQNVKRGDIIGRLFSRDSVADNYFEFSIKKRNGKTIDPNW